MGQKETSTFLKRCDSESKEKEKGEFFSRKINSRFSPLTNFLVRKFFFHHTSLVRHFTSSMIERNLRFSSKWSDIITVWNLKRDRLTLLKSNLQLRSVHFASLSYPLPHPNTSSPVFLSFPVGPIIRYYFEINTFSYAVGFNANRNPFRWLRSFNGWSLIYFYWG